MDDSLLRVALAKLFLWSEPSRFQEYPAALARAESCRKYTRVEVERVLFDIVPTMEFKGGAPRGRGTQGIINAHGLDRSGDRFRIDGIDLFRRSGKGVVATEAGLDVGRQFREDPDSTEWPRKLARQFLLREPRSRLLVGLLLRGRTMEVGLAGSTPVGKVTLVGPDDSRTPIVQRGCSSFNELLSLNAELALGPRWRADLDALGAHGRVHFEGVQGDEPSTNDLPTALKKGLALLLHVGVFGIEGKRWTTDPSRLSRAVGVDVAQSFKVEASTASRVMNDDQAFAWALAETADTDGYVIVSQLADRFGTLLDVPAPERARVLDSFVRGAMYHERLRIIEQHPGQPRMGRGLFGETGSRRVRLDFHITGPPPAAVPETFSSLDHGGESTGGDR